MLKSKKKIMSKKKKESVKSERMQRKKSKIRVSAPKKEINKKEDEALKAKKAFKMKEIENAGLFEAFESILKSYYNGGLKKDINIFEFSIHRIKAFESNYKSKMKKLELMKKYQK